ncbi:MAG: protein kinase [Planctomycetota bacterium]|nr:protein kinase [Planctomycetota bacterium]
MLHKVADAIAFSHSRGILHRDLKPDNVMIGEFGEALVMDWGLALPVGDFDKKGLALSFGPCGTPACMAPEMARQHGKVTTASDIYLLGAQLFRLATGKAPHTAKSARACLRAAARNKIIEVERDDELVAIARKAMSTRPEDRHSSAQEFQAALSEYRSHKESRAMTERAIEKLAAAQRAMSAGASDYRPFERALVSFEETVTLWDGNQTARDQLRETQLTYARSAFAREDFDLASQQLDGTDPEHAALLSEIRSAREEYDTRLARLQRVKQVAAGLAAAVFVVVSVSSFLLYRSWRSEQQAHTIAQEQFHQAHEAIAGSGETVPNADSTEQLESAVAQFQIAVEQIAPLLNSGVPQYLDDAAWIHSHLADVQIQLGRKDEAIVSAKPAINLRAKLTSPQHLHNQAWLLTHSLVSQIRDPVEAVRLAGLATKSAPANPDYLNTLAAAHLAAGNLKEAAAALTRAENARRKPSPADQLIRSMLERKNGNPNEADALLEAALKLADETAPGNPKLLRLRGEAKVASQAASE